VQSSSQIVTTNKSTPGFLQAGCPASHPTNSVKALKDAVTVAVHPRIYTVDLLVQFCPVFCILLACFTVSFSVILPC